MKKLITLLLSLCLLLSACSETPASSAITGDDMPVEAALTVGYEPFGGQFSPFYAECANDWDVVDMTQLRLLYSDRSGAVVYKGIEGETRPYNGTDYTYYGPTDLSVTENEDGTVYYDFTLREDLVFSDGTPVTIDNLIFSLYVLLDPSYDGSNRLNTMPIQGLEEYHAGADAISGIRRTGDYSLRVVANMVDARVVYYLGSVYIAPLHYYGDAAQYDYEGGKFGFPKGDLSAIQEKTGLPLGAGPYRFVSYADKRITFQANEAYYLGVPETNIVCFREIPWEEWYLQADGLLTGELDLTYLHSGWGYIGDAWEAEIGSTLTRVLVHDRDSAYYQCVGINCDTVKVGSDRGSDASKALRKALATVIAASRQTGLDISLEMGAHTIAAVVDYPVSSTAWLVPGANAPDYAAAYSKDVDGNDIYTPDMTEEERLAAAKQAALGFFEAAGYTVENGMVTAAPIGARLEYEVQVMANISEITGETSDNVYHALVQASAALAELGVTLNVVNTSERENDYFPDQGQCDLWGGGWDNVDMNGLYCGSDCAADWYAMADVETQLYEVYCSTSGNSATYPDADRHIYHMSDPALDELILAARSTVDQTLRRELYSQCIDIITDWGCEVPFYETCGSFAYRNDAIETDSVARDLTVHYTWLREIHNIELK